MNNINNNDDNDELQKWLNEVAQDMNVPMVVEEFNKTPPRSTSTYER